MIRTLLLALPFALGILFRSALLSIIFWLWMLIDCARSDLKEIDKLIWILVIVFFSLVGAFMYLIFVKLNKNYKGIQMYKKAKRLYRSKKERIIAGVCGGIAEYFNVDPSIVRLLWALFALMGGSGILAYIIAWIIIPLEK